MIDPEAEHFIHELKRALAEADGKYEIDTKLLARALIWILHRLEEIHPFIR